VSSRDRLNRPDPNSSRSRTVRSSEPYQSDDVEQDFWDIEPEASGEYAQDEPAPRTRSQVTRRNRAITPPRGGTADQIDRLQRTMRSGRDEVQAPGQSRGRNYLARSPRPASPVEDDESWDDDTSGWEESVAPRQTRRTVEPQPSRYREYDPEPWDADQDDDSYYDDEDDFDEYDAPVRQSPIARAPSIRMVRPNVGRPSMPSAIAQADLVNDAPALGMIGLGLASLAGMAILVANRVETLDPSLATHVSASGVLENFRGREAIWRLPLLSAMLTLMNVGAAWFISPIDRFASRFLIAAAILVQFVAWVALIRIL